MLHTISIPNDGSSVLGTLYLDWLSNPGNQTIYRYKKNTHTHSTKSYHENKNPNGLSRTVSSPIIIPSLIGTREIITTTTTAAATARIIIIINPVCFQTAINTYGEYIRH